MRIALVHYHLRRGGVTSVLANQAKVITDGGDDVLVITGELADGGFKYPEALVGELMYDGVNPLSAAKENEAARTRANHLANRLADKITYAMKSRWGEAADVVHVHNPLIEKNAALLPALHIMNKNGLCLLLQNHDLAEDFRPDVYIAEGDYPEDCHYAAINTRDYSFLRRAGLKPEGLHLLPNEVAPISPGKSGERTRYVYPVRAIRRKNIGEVLLLSCYIPGGRTIAVTLPPASVRDRELYDHWKNLARSLKLPVEFEVGLRENFADVIGSAAAVITTSVKEGFGFSYLEPWTANRAVMGRRIDNVCQDFENSGIQFDSLYNSLNIPMVYLSAPVLRKKMARALDATYAAFGVKAPSYILSMMEDDINSHDVFDFGRLDEELQTGVIETVVANEAVRRDIADINPFLNKLAVWREEADLIASNREKVLCVYGADKIACELRRTYRKVAENKVTHHLSRAMLLELFLNPLKLSLVGLSNE